MKEETLQLVGAEYMEPVKEALIALGGSARKQDVLARAKELIGDRTGESERTVEVKITWARQYLVEAGIMDGSERGVWKLAEGGADIPIDEALMEKVREIEATKEKSEKKSGHGGKSADSIKRWFQPVVEALRTLGGSAKPEEVRRQIIADVKPDEEYLKKTRGKNNINLFQNEVDFARSYLAQAGIIDKSVRGVWTLTDQADGLTFDDATVERILNSWKVEPKAKKNDTVNTMADDDVEKTHFWIYAPGDNASQWDAFREDGIMAIGWDELGDLREYETKDDMREKMQECYEADKSYRNTAHATWQFCNEIKPGDVVFVKRGRTMILGKGIVESDYEFDPDRSEYKHLRRVKWLCSGEWKSPIQLAMKTLTDATAYMDDVNQLNALFEGEDEDDETETVVDYPTYTKQNFLSEVYMDEEKYDRLVKLLRRKKNIILQGAPGVGKTFAAKRLAYSMMGVKDISRVEMVQFHQSYSYEDFVVGYRPTETGFEKNYGPFYKFCVRAQNDEDNDYFFIIDEINRGNLSKIFGELFMLIESDKRGAKLNLLYVNESFSVPPNVHIIGMMNTADRSLAMMDYALRRRFSFYEFEPAFDTAGFGKYRKAVDNPKFDRLIDCVKELNRAIEEDPSLGRGFRIGHSYFVINKPKDADDDWLKKQVDDDWLNDVIDYELIPLLEEYWFDDAKKVEEWTERLKLSQREGRSNRETKEGEDEA